MDCIPDRAFLASFRDALACGRGTGGVAVLNPRLRSGKPSGLKESNGSPPGSGWPAAMGVHPGEISDSSRRSQKSKFPKPDGLAQANPGQANECRPGSGEPKVIPSHAWAI